MDNTQLLTLLSRTPLTEEDRYNVMVIFRAIGEERQQHILEQWEHYAARLIVERERLDKEYHDELLATLRQANTLLDEAMARKQEKDAYEASKRKKIREDLEATAAYNQMRQMRRIRDIARTHS